MARTDTLGNFLTDVADAIRAAEGSSETIQASDFDTRIEALSGGGGNYNVLVDATKTYNQNGGLKSLIVEIDELDISNMKNITSIFTDCTNLTVGPIMNTSNVTNMTNMFSGCTNLTTVPLYDTSSVTSMNMMFRVCKQLANVPLFNTSKVKNFSNMFYGCQNLSTESLDNILQMCINASSYTSTKTLVQLGFDNTNQPAGTIQALPHYQDFINAGWTIGY